MKQKRAVTAAFAILLIALILFFLQLSFHNSRSPQNGKANPESIESLRAMPYVQWTDKEVDPSLRGVQIYDRSSAFTGFNLFTNDADQVFLMDMNGKIVHRWKIPGMRQCEYAEITNAGDLIAVCVSQALVKLDWNSDILWENRIPVHHDFTLLPDEKILAIYKGRPENYNGYRVDFDSIAIVSPAGKNLAKWSTFENRTKLSKFHAPSPLDIPRNPAAEKAREENTRYDYYHLNAVQALPDTPLGRVDKRFKAGNLLICLRNVNRIVVLNRDTFEIEWSWGTNSLDYPHMPRMLSDGHILVFDNGTHRKFSRVLEIDPVSGKILWEYKGNPPASFFSAWRGSNQRLPNGNTLICDSENGRAFEITKKGRIVWDFWNPEIRNGHRKRIYRFTRLSPSFVEPLLLKLGSARTPD